MLQSSFEMENNQSVHQTILTNEVVKFLLDGAGDKFLDATFGGGGHSRAVLEANNQAVVYGIDRDPTTAVFARALKNEFPQRFHFQSLTYTEMKKIGVAFDGIIFDLGLSSDQLESSGRGFSFRKTDEPLDLRFNPDSGQTASEFLKQAPLQKLELVFRNYAEDKYWRHLARTVLERRREVPLRTVGDFIALVGNGSPKVLAPLFQGLRIAVNDELSNLNRGLEQAKDCLNPGGRLAVISFHSLEDRIVKEFFRQEGWKIVTKKPILPSYQEQSQNSRSRSAKLRMAVKI